MKQVFESGEVALCLTKEGVLVGPDSFSTVRPNAPDWTIIDILSFFVIAAGDHGFVDYGNLDRVDDPDLFTSEYIENFGDPRGLFFSYQLFDQPSIYYVLFDYQPWPGYRLDPAPYRPEDNAYHVETFEIYQLLEPVGGWRQDRINELEPFILDQVPPYEPFIDAPHWNSRHLGQRTTRLAQLPPYPKYDSWVGYEATRGWHSTPKGLTVSNLNWSWTDLIIPQDYTLSPAEIVWISTYTLLRRRPRVASGGIDSSIVGSGGTDLDPTYPYDSHVGLNENWLTWHPADRKWLVSQRSSPTALPKALFHLVVSEADSEQVEVAGTLEYEHHQDVPSTIWTITHNLGTTDYEFEATDILGNRISPTISDRPDNNTLTLTFSTAVYGRVYIGRSNEYEAFSVMFWELQNDAGTLGVTLRTVSSPTVTLQEDSDSSTENSSISVDFE